MAEISIFDDRVPLNEKGVIARFKNTITQSIAYRAHGWLGNDTAASDNDPSLTVPPMMEFTAGGVTLLFVKWDADATVDSYKGVYTKYIHPYSDVGQGNLIGGSYAAPTRRYSDQVGATYLIQLHEGAGGFSGGPDNWNRQARKPSDPNIYKHKDSRGYSSLINMPWSLFISGAAVSESSYQDIRLWFGGFSAFAEDLWLPLLLFNSAPVRNHRYGMVFSGRPATNSFCEKLFKQLTGKKPEDIPIKFVGGGSDRITYVRNRAVDWPYTGNLSATTGGRYAEIFVGPSASHRVVYPPLVLPTEYLVTRDPQYLRNHLVIESPDPGDDGQYQIYEPNTRGLPATLDFLVGARFTPEQDIDVQIEFTPAPAAELRTVAIPNVTLPTGSRQPAKFPLATKLDLDTADRSVSVRFLDAAQNSLVLPSEKVTLNLRDTSTPRILITPPRHVYSILIPAADRHLSPSEWGSVKYGVALADDPGGAVTVNISVHPPGGAAIGSGIWTDKTQLVFNSQNYNQAQTVTVYSDNVDRRLNSATVVHATPSDSGPAKWRGITKSIFVRERINRGIVPRGRDLGIGTIPAYLGSRGGRYSSPTLAGESVSGKYYIEGMVLDLVKDTRRVSLRRTRWQDRPPEIERVDISSLADTQGSPLPGTMRVVHGEIVPVTEYEARHRLVTDPPGPWTTAVTSASATDENGDYIPATAEFSLRNLQSQAKYEVEVRARNTAGPGPWSRTKTFITT